MSTTTHWKASEKAGLNGLDVPKPLRPANNTCRSKTACKAYRIFYRILAPLLVETSDERETGSPLFSVEQEKGRIALLAIPAGCQILRTEHRFWRPAGARARQPPVRWVRSVSPSFPPATFMRASGARHFPENQTSGAR